MGQIRKLAQQVAETLGEHEPKTLAQLERIIHECGIEQVDAWVGAAQAAIADGTARRQDGTPRTLGGAFFRIVKDALPNDQRHKLGLSAPPAAALPPLFIWNDRVALVAQLEKGSALTVKITIIGRPGRMQECAGFFATLMQNDTPPNNFAKGMPNPPAEPTSYLVFLPAKQARRVLEALTSDKDDRLIVEGWAAFDEQLKKVCVWGQRITTVGLERQKRDSNATPA